MASALILHNAGIIDITHSTITLKLTAEQKKQLKDEGYLFHINTKGYFQILHDQKQPIITFSSLTIYEIPSNYWYD